MDTGHALERYDQDSIFNIHALGLDLKANRRMRIAPSCVDALGDTGFFLAQFRVSGQALSLSCVRPVDAAR